VSRSGGGHVHLTRWQGRSAAASTRADDTRAGGELDLAGPQHGASRFTLESTGNLLQRNSLLSAMVNRRGVADSSLAAGTASGDPDVLAVAKETPRPIAGNRGSQDIDRIATETDPLFRPKLR
jgi:hypothetical protein